MLLSFVPLLLPLCFRAVQAVDSLVDVEYTQYEGTEYPSGVTQWLGIRYAAPPVGDLRFREPQDPLKNDTVQVADTHGLICLATGGLPNDTATSEDCLFMDIYAPSNATNSSNLPVMFFIQGGGFNSNSNPNLNGTGLVKASGYNMVVVTINYRVGPWGFLASEEVQNHGSLNNGIKDQRHALKWTKNHISRFGGDPDHIVIAGDSAGAASVTLQLTAYGGKDDGLFIGAAAESQSFATVFNVSESQYQYDNLIIRTGCITKNDTLACLRNLTTAEIQAVNFNTPSPGAQIAPLYMYGPVVDDDLIPDVTYRLLEQGKFVKVPVIFGDDTNEGTVFVPNTTADISASDTFLKAQFPYLKLSQLAKINSMYPLTNQTFNGTGAYWRKTANAYGEIRYICPGIYLSKVYTESNTTENWNYHYDVQDPTSEAEGYGVPHTVEVNAIWGPYNTNGGAPASYYTTNSGIVPVMQGYWTSFVRSLNPNTHRYPGSPEWKTTGNSSDRRLYIRTNATKMETIPSDQRERCSYLSSIGDDLHQ